MTSLIRKTQELPDGVRLLVFEFIRHPLAEIFKQVSKPILLQVTGTVHSTPAEIANLSNLEACAYSYGCHNCVLPFWNNKIKEIIVGKGLPIPFIQRVYFKTKPKFQDLVFFMAMIAMFG